MTPPEGASGQPDLGPEGSELVADETPKSLIEGLRFEQVQRALGSAGAGLWHVDEAAQRVDQSAQMRLLLGSAPTPASTALSELQALLAPEEQARVQRAVDVALGSGGSLVIDLRVQRLDGTSGWLQVTGDLERIPEDGTIRGGGLAIDITERKRNEQRMALVESVSRTIARADNLDAAAPDLLAAITRGTETQIASLWLSSLDDHVLRAEYLHAEAWAAEHCTSLLQQTREAAFALGEGLPGTVWAERAPARLSAVAGKPGFERLGTAIDEGLTAGMAFPLLAGSVFIGVIEVLGDGPTDSDDRLAETLSMLGREMGQFILRSRAEERLRASGARQRLLVSILEGQRAVEAESLVMEVASEQLGRYLDAARVGFFEVEGDRLSARSGWSADGVEPVEDPLPAPDHGGSFWQEVHAGRVVAIDDVTSDPRSAETDLTGLGDRGLISVPVMRSGERVAGMYVHSFKPREWTRADRYLCREVADHTWDTVERLRAEQGRRESDLLARTISDNSSQGLVLLDAEGLVRYANAAAVEMMGLGEDEVGTRPLHDLVHHHHPDGRPYPRSDCPIDRALTDQVPLREHGDLFFRQDGSAFPVICSASPVTRSGHPDGTVLEIRDVSASRSAARQLAATERRFQATFENAAVGMAHVGLDGRWLQVNRRLCQIVGYSEPELLQLTFHDVTHPDDLDSDVEHVQALLRGEAESYSLEKRYLRPDGRPLWAELTVALVRDGDGLPEYFIAVVSDIEARKSVEARMQAALAVKEEFLGLVSHELRTPMTVIMGMSQILASRSFDPAQTRSMAEEIGESAAQLHDLIESMLVLARMDKDEEAMREPAQLSRVAADTVARRRGRDRSREYLLETPGLVLVDAHPSLLDRVISNLVVNAGKYSRPGEPVQVVVEKQDHEAVLRVLDRGPGLDDDELTRVFEPFYRGAGARQAPGAGLGLSVVSRIIEALGGRVWAGRTEQGSEFGFALPALRPDDD